MDLLYHTGRGTIQTVPDFLTKLNKEQQQAVTHDSGPAVVLAGAGSGKTTVLTTRVAWLIAEQKVKPQNLMVVTFTNKAAGEIKERIANLTGFSLPFSGTFHSLCVKILRKDGHHLGIDPNFVIYDTQDQKSLLKLICKNKHIDPQKYTLGAVQGAISEAKNQMILASEYTQMANSSFQEHVSELYRHYQAELDKASALDFDDLLLKTLQLLLDTEEVREKYQQQFEHVLVDEYQDTNTVQYQLTKVLARPQNNLFVVGDFSQSIYAWRGADYRNMLRLKEDFDDIKEYRLEQNYRSHQSILDAATQVISQNTSHPILKLWTDRGQEQPLVLHETYSAQDEANKVAGYISSIYPSISYEEMAILYRTNAQSRAFEEALIQASIPYRLVGGTKFYERAEIKDVLAYLKYLINPLDLVSYERIVKLGKRRFAKFQKWQKELEKKGPTDIATLEPAVIIKSMLDATNYLSKFSANNEDNFARVENVKELVNVSAQFDSLAQFLENVALVQDDYFADIASEGGSGGVSLMSFHSAKGLEFEAVFMVGAEEGLLPHSRSLMDPDQMEEERRLCYVGITRAKQKLFITYARSRYQYGTQNDSLRSRFVNDISKDLLDFRGGGYYQNQKNDFPNSSNKPVSSGRKYVPLDDDLLDGVLNGEIDIDKLL